MYNPGMTSIQCDENDEFAPIPSGCNAPHRHGLDCQCALILLAAGAPTVVGPSAEIQRWAANYLTHNPRFSDSSLYDEVCTICGARDLILGEDQLTKFSCEEFLER
jgi:hypothetical protein